MTRPHGTDWTIEILCKLASLQFLRRLLLMACVVLDQPVAPLVPDSAIMLAFYVAEINPLV
ncbi:hypothetical protein AUC61_10365 [Pseudomonas sp. S25]|uniref:Uncharacterized protein n=1 Tax=Pseudomonas maioricensis TaxID=1766623 RepID=A0ABS9ZH60_9PSED|nr:hypothetical protein [Pseudomonas sp. S25]